MRLQVLFHVLFQMVSHDAPNGDPFLAVSGVPLSKIQTRTPLVDFLGTPCGDPLELSTRGDPIVNNQNEDPSGRQLVAAIKKRCS